MYELSAVSRSSAERARSASLRVLWVALALLGACKHTARDLNPDDTSLGTLLRGGRTTAVSIVPRSGGRNLLTLAENGGVFGSVDGGRSWRSNVLPDGSRGPFGNGFARGLTSFEDLVVDPFDTRNVLVMVGDDARVRDGDTQDGVWRSTDGGETWARTTNAAPPCRISGAYLSWGGANHHIRFSPDRAGVVFATTDCRLGVSIDHGATWDWISPSPAAPDAGLDGIDVWRAQRPRAGMATQNTIAFCANVRTPTPPGSIAGARTVFLYDLGAGTFEQFPSPPLDAGRGACSVAVDPDNLNHIFVATGGAYGTTSDTISKVWDGMIMGAPGSSRKVAWTDLLPTSGDAGNGRPAFVTVHRNAGRLRVYFHNTTWVFYTDCPLGGPCTASTTTLYPGCGLEETPPSSVWTCLARPLPHADVSAIAFDPDLPNQACPTVLATDGGNFRSEDCGGTWSTSNVGLHALQPWQAAFARSGMQERLWLATQDNGMFLSADDGSHWAVDSCGDAFWADILRTDPDRGARNCNGYLGYVPALDTGAGMLIANYNDPASGPGSLAAVGEFIGPDAYVVPVFVTVRRVDPPSARLSVRLKRFRVSDSTWQPYGDPVSNEVLPPGGGGGWMAIGGRANAATDRVVYLALPALGGPNYLLHGHDTGAADGSGLESTWTRSPELTDPIQVWASDNDPNWAIAYNRGTGARGIFVTRDGGAHWTRDVAASSAITGGGAFASLNTVYSPIDSPVTTVAFDPGVGGRVAIGTTHNGIVISSDHGASWEVNHTMPEPNGGAVAIAFDEDTTELSAHVATWGRGVWAVTF